MINKNNYKYYTTREMSEIFKKNGIDIDEYCNSFRSCISKSHKELHEKISIRVGQNVCYSKDFIDSIDFSYLLTLKNIQCKTIFKHYMRYHIYGEATIEVASKILDCHRSTLDKIVQEENEIFIEIIRDGQRYVKLEKVYEWKNFKESVVDSDIIIERINKDIDEKRKGYKLFYYKKIYKIYEQGKFGQSSMFLEANTPFRTLGNKKIYIKKEYEEEIYQMLKKELLNNTYYYTIEEMDEIFRKNSIDIENFCLNFRTSLSKFNKELYKKISKRVGNNVLYSKEFIDSINFDYLRILKNINNRHIFKRYMDYQIYGETTIGTACSILSIHPDTLTKIIKEDNDIFTETIRKGFRYIKLEKVLEWRDFKEKVVSLRDIVERINKDIAPNGNCCGLNYNKEVLKMYEDNIFEKFQIVPESDTPFRTLGNKQLYVKKQFEDDIYKMLSEKLLNKFKYYTQIELGRFFINNGIELSCKDFRLAILNYNSELYKEVVILKDNTFMYMREFINELDLKYLIKLKENNEKNLFEKLLIHQFSDELKYYSIKDLYDVFSENGVEIDKYCTKFRNVLKQYYEDFNKEVSIKIKQEVLYKKDFIDSINFDFLRKLQILSSRKIFFNYMSYHIYKEITLYSASNILGCSESTLCNVGDEDNDIITINLRNGYKYIKFEDVIKWEKFKDSMIDLNKIVKSVKEEIGEQERGGKLYYIHKIDEMYKNGIFSEFKIIPESDTPFRTPGNREFYVKKEYEKEIYKVIKEQLTNKVINSFGSKVDRFKHKFQCIDTKNKEYSLEEFLNFAIHRISTLSKPTVGTYIDIAKNIEKLNKEVTKYTTEEVENVLNCLKTRKSKGEFTLFLSQIKKKNNTKYSDVTYNPNCNKVKRNTKPYTSEQYIRFGFLVWSDSHIWYESYMEKALNKREYASVWLYAALHYVCAWRLSDLLKQFPRPNIHMDPKVFLETVKNKELENEIALDIINQINLKIELEEPVPNKTRNNNPPSLVLQIPESIYVFLGTLIGIAEAHYQLSPHPGKKGILSEICKRRKKQIEFFGEEFTEIFGNDSFSNLRAIKNYEILMCRKGDKEKLGTGYLLASIARSHKYTVDKLSETTKIYLEYYKDMEDGEILVRELFERGVCSFVPYLLTKIVAGKDVINELSQKERTKKIKEIAPIDAYDTEIFLQTYNSGLNNAKAVVKELIDDAVKEGISPKDIAKSALEKLSYEEASSKQDKLYCIIRAQGKKCRYPKRKNCIGCGYEVYLKSCLSELGNVIKKTKQQAISSKTQNSRNKNILMIQNVFIPIVSEILITLKDVYKIENIDEYKKFIQ